MKIAVVLIFAALVASASAQTNLTSFPPFSAAADNYLPTTDHFAHRIDLRAGYGINLTSHDPVAAAAVAISLAPALSLGAVASHDRTGWIAGGLTLSVNGSAQVPLIGRVDMFAGDGVAYDVQLKKAANYLFVGAERPFLLWGCRLSPGFTLANTSTRAGTELIGGLSFVKTF